MALTKINDRSVASGTFLESVTATDLPAGSFVQAQSYALRSREQISVGTVGSFVASSMQVTITPKTSNPKFLILFDLKISDDGFNAVANVYDETAGVRVLTGIAESNKIEVTSGPMGGGGLGNAYGTDSRTRMGIYTPPSNASATRTFRVYVSCVNSTTVVNLAGNDADQDAAYNSYSPCELTVIEIAG
jgi:hypothetical protein